MPVSPLILLSVTKNKPQIARHLVSLTHSISLSRVNQFLEGEVKLKINEISIKGKVKWDCDLQPISQPIDVSIANLKIANKQTLNFNSDHGEIILLGMTCRLSVKFGPCSSPR